MVAMLTVLAAVLYWPSAQDRAAGKLEKYQMNVLEANGNVLKAALPDLKVDKFQQAFMDLDETAYRRFEEPLRQSRNKTHAAQIAGQELTRYLQANRAYVSNIDVKHIDAMLNLTEKNLHQASRKNNRFCNGSEYAALNTKTASPQSLEAIGELFSEQSSQYVIDMATLMLEATHDARARPASHGSMSRVDKAAMQGVMLSLSLIHI